MNKDTLTASIIGFGLGIVAAISLWAVPRILPKPAAPASSSEEVAGVKSNEEETMSQGLSITSPLDGHVTREKSIQIEGKSMPGAKFVVVTTPQGNQVVEPDAEDKFTASISLSEGSNDISVTGYENEATDSKDISVYYFEDDL